VSFREGTEKKNCIPHRNRLVKGRLTRKSMSNKHKRGCLRPSIWTATIFETISDYPFKSYDFSLHKSKFHPLSPTKDNGGKPQINGKDLWQTADHRKNRWSAGKPTGDEKLAVPVATASQIVFQGADRIKLKTGVDMPDINQKVKPRTMYHINLRARPTCLKIFTSIEQKF
jgi:hypothetical protein